MAIYLSTNLALKRICCHVTWLEELWQFPGDVLKAAVENLVQARDARTTRNMARWAASANAFDAYARYMIPWIYFLSLIVVFNLDMTDQYGGESKTEMFSGLGPTTLNTGGTIAAILYVLVTAMIILFSVASTRYPCGSMPAASHACFYM